MASRGGYQDKKLIVWQWNARSIKEKLGSLLQYIDSGSDKPDVLALQEVNSHARLPGYIPHGDTECGGTSTVISKRVMVVQHALELPRKERPLTELIPWKPEKGKSVFIPNVYCGPKRKQSELRSLIQQAVQVADSCPLVVLGDINVAHPEWISTI